MPNYSFGYGKACLEKIFLGEFISLISSYNDSKILNGKKKVYPTQVDNIEMIEETADTIKISFRCKIPRTFENWINLSDEYISINEVIKSCHVKRLTLLAEEDGIAFKERLYFDDNETDVVLYESQELWNQEEF